MGERLSSGVARVQVPATSANLGPGFDALGLALDLTDELTAQITGDGFRVTVTGEGADEVATGRLATGEEHLVLGSMLRAFDRMGVDRPEGVTLTCHNQIPHARGLGSSSAAIVAGVVLARALAADAGSGRAGSGRTGSGRTGFDDAAALRLAAEIEGHPDNVAPCLLGGFTIAWTGPDGAQAVRTEPDPVVKPMIYVPETRALTAAARAALPATVPHTDAVFNAARVALLVHALTTDPSRLFEATEDRLHQPYRAPAMPETATLVRLLRRARIPAVVSGAGPSVLALVRPGDEAVEPPDGWCARSLSVNLTGARMLASRHAEGDPVAAGPPS
jgi:homoserine kinase